MSVEPRNEEQQEKVDAKASENNPMPSEIRYVKRVLLTVGIVLTVAALVTVFCLSIRVWLVLFAGILLGVFFRTLAFWVGKLTRLPAVWALVVVVITLLGLAVLGSWIVAPQVANQFAELSDRLPKALETIRARVDQLGWDRFIPRRLPPLTELTSSAGKLAANAAGFFTVSLEAVSYFFVILFLGIYLAAAPDLYLNGVIALFPRSLRSRAREVFGALGTTLGHWILGQMLSMAVVGTLVAVGLTLLGVPLGLALGVLAGLLNFIPLVGSLLSAIPAILLAFLVSPLHPLYVIILYVVINTVIESHLLVPLIQRYAVDLPPAVAVLALLLMGKLFGFMGLLLAIPLAATILVLVKMIYVERMLGDKRSGKSDTKKPQAP